MTQRTSRGHLASIRKALRRIAKTGDQVDFRRYMMSDAFQEAWLAVPQGRHLEIFMAVASTQAQVEARNPLPPPSNRTAYWNAERIEALRVAWERHGGEVIRVAIELGITPDSARLAHRRYIVGGATPVKAEKIAQYARSRAGTPSATGQNGASDGIAQAA